MVLRCGRNLAFHAGMAALFSSILGALIGPIVRQGTTEWVPAVVILGVLGMVEAYFLLSLRGRVVMSETGIEIVETFRRRQFTWAEISDMRIRDGARAWDVVLHTPAGPVRVVPFAVPVYLGVRARFGFVAGSYMEPPANTPKSLKRVYDLLHAEWKLRRFRVPGGAG